MKKKLTPKYFVGIDFGHGETSASRTPGRNGNETSSIPLRNSGSIQDHKVISAIYKNKKGEWRFLKSINDFKQKDIREGFKNQIRRMSDKDKESMREFSKLVFEAILENDDDLKYDPKTGESNFLICIACPSGWHGENPDIPLEYLKFFHEDAGIKPIKMCINESDAAFYTKMKIYSAEDTVLVIDIGSSTIDFTTYQNSEIIHEFCWSVNLGAHKIEEKLVEYGFTKAPNAQENKENRKKISAIREKNNLDDNNSALILGARMEKEEYFTNEMEVFGYNLMYYNLFDGWSNPTESAFSVLLPKENEDNPEESVEGVISDYAASIEMSLKELFLKLSGRGITPNKVLLSGGASRMSFIKNIARKIFKKAEIMRDKEPEWVVSHGAAKYAQKHYSALLARNELQQEFKEWARENLDAKFKEATLTAINNELERTLLDTLETEYIKSESNGSLIDFYEKTVDLLEGMGSSPNFINNAKKEFCSIVDDLIISKLENIIEDKYGKKVKIEEHFVDPGESFNNIYVSPKFLAESIANIADKYCNTIFEGPGNLNWEKSRPEDTRRKMVKKLVEVWKYDKYTHDVKMDVFIDQAVEKIDKVLHENGLFVVSEWQIDS